MRTIVTLLLAAFWIPAAAQSKTIRLKADLSTLPLPFHYNKITVIDSRVDTTVAGWVTKGIDNILAPAVFEKPAAQAIQEMYLKAAKDILAQGTDELVVHITDLFLFEDPEEMGTVGNMDLRLQLFIRRGDKYHPVYLLDKQQPFKSLDVTKAMFRELNSSLVEALYAANERHASASSYGLSWSEVLQIRQYEIAQRFPVYRTAQLKDGLYADVRSFLEQTPTEPVSAVSTRIEENLAKPRRKRQQLFGFCRDGIMYVFNGPKKYDSVQLYRQDGQFFKQDWGLDPARQAASATVGWLFGFGAELLAEEAGNGDRSWYEFVFNPRTAQFYHYRFLAENKEAYLKQKNNPEAETPSGTQRP